MNQDQIIVQRVVEYEGKRYVYNGKSWRGESDFMNPPSGIIPHLNALIADQLAEDDDAITNPHDMIERASELRDMPGHLERSLRLAQRAHDMNPEDPGVACVLSSILRRKNRWDEAISVTDRVAHISHAPMLTSRAAAYCDLKQWPEALQCIRKALAISKGKDNGEALSVWQRIKSEAPHLFP